MIRSHGSLSYCINDKNVKYFRYAKQNRHSMIWHYAFWGYICKVERGLLLEIKL